MVSKRWCHNIKNWGKGKHHCNTTIVASHHYAIPSASSGRPSPGLRQVPVPFCNFLHIYSPRPEKLTAWHTEHREAKEAGRTFQVPAALAEAWSDAFLIASTQNHLQKLALKEMELTWSVQVSGISNTMQLILTDSQDCTSHTNFLTWTHIGTATMIDFEIYVLPHLKMIWSGLKEKKNYLLQQESHQRQSSGLSIWPQPIWGWLRKSV